MMKSKLTPGLSGYITLTFYIALITLPFLALSGSNIADGFRCTFVTFPTNYLLYIAPAALFFFLKKSDIAESDRILYLAAFDMVTVVIMHSAVQTNRSDVFFTLVATVIIALIIININDAVANIVLLSGFLVLRSPTAYIFAVYIPVLLLIMIQTFSKTETTEKKKHFLFFTYLYIPVPVLILFFAKKISFNIHPVNINFSIEKNIIELISGMALLIVAAVVFIIRVLPVIKRGKITEKISMILFSVYPLAMSVLNCIFILAESQFSHAILLSLVMYIAGNIQVSLSYGKELPIIPEKMNNPICFIAVLLIFCSFCFK